MFCIIYEKKCIGYALKIHLSEFTLVSMGDSE